MERMRCRAAHASRWPQQGGLRDERQPREVRQANEGKAIVQTLAFMSHYPPIGRVLERDGVKKFQRLAERLAQDLPEDGDPE